MIPKIIHYCWFGGGKKPSLIKKCIKSWTKHLPDYEIRCWNDSSFDFNSIVFTREALSVKKYAALSDYVRLYALYNYGGIYLDTDVTVYKSFDALLDNLFFSGYEYFDKFEIESGIIGSIKGFPFLKECMSYYENTPFIHKDGEYDIYKKQAPGIITDFAKKHGYQATGEEQILSNGIHLYPRNIFANECYGCKTFGDFHKVDTTNITALHHNMGSWATVVNKRGNLWKFCWEHNMLDFYKKIEKLRVILQNKQ